MPVSQMGAINTNKFSRLKKDYTDKMLYMELHKSVAYGRTVKYKLFFDKLFPEL